MTYPLWLTQSLMAAGRPAPYWVNAGVGGHTTGQMLERMGRDVMAQDLTSFSSMPGLTT